MFQIYLLTYKLTIKNKIHMATYSYKYMPGETVLFSDGFSRERTGEIAFIRIGKDVAHYEIKTDDGILHDVQPNSVLGHPHEVSEEDLKNNPELADAGVKVGDTVGIPGEEDNEGADDAE